MIFQKVSGKQLYFIIAITQVIMTLFFVQLLNPIELIKSNLIEQLSIVKIHHIIEKNRKWIWVSTLTIPFILLFKVFLINICFKIGSFFNGVKINNLIKIVLYSELIFIASSFIKFIWFWTHKANLSLEYVQTFAPLSLVSLFNTTEIEKWALYPLQTINAFEILYWLTLSWLISKELKLKFWKSFEFVMSTYGVGLLIWIVFVMFLTINMS
jgi:hypothetical protein